MKYLYYFGLVLIFSSCGESENEKPQSGTKKPKASNVEKSLNEWTYRAVRIENKGWGYQLFRGPNLEINQQNVPAVNGLHYFETEEKASLAAELALSKIEQGHFPPTVEPAELDSIGAVNLDSLIEITNNLR